MIGSFLLKTSECQVIEMIKALIAMSGTIGDVVGSEEDNLWPYNDTDRLVKWA